MGRPKSLFKKEKSKEKERKKEFQKLKFTKMILQLIKY